MKNFFKLSRSQGEIIDVKCEKSAILIFLAIIELVRELVISNMHNKLWKDTRKTFQVIAQVDVNAEAAQLQLQ